MPKTLLVTGGAGFIGCNFVRLALRQKDVAKVVVVDKLTYAGSMENLAEPRQDPRFVFLREDITDARAMGKAVSEHQPDAIVNFAAESHVDRSIDGPAAFVQTNFVGVFTLLEACREIFLAWPKQRREAFRFLQVSTDEVYGSLGPTGFFTEETPYAPNSPYSASKASADHLVRAYFHTYGLPTLITNCSNNYGPYQFPEKLIPLMILNGLEGKDLPVYGDGGNVRDWIHVEDHCEGVWLALTKGKPGEKYNLGGHNERGNLAVVKQLCAELEKLKPASGNEILRAKGKKGYAELITFVKDRPGHDRRYAIDPAKSERELGWKAKHTFDQGLGQTVAWYAAHRDWCAKVQSGKYERERLGLK